jgi:hypothetical protein
MLVPPPNVTVDYSRYFSLLITSTNDLSQIVGVYVPSPLYNATEAERNLLAVTRGCQDSCESAEKTFTWHLTEFTNLGMQLQVDLDSPSLVSAMSTDYLQLELIDTSLFWAENGLMLEKSGVRLSNCESEVPVTSAANCMRFPPQLSAEVAMVIGSTGESMDATMQNAMKTNLFITVTLGSSTQELFSMIRQLQWFLNLALVDTPLPGNLLYFMQ